MTSHRFHRMKHVLGALISALVLTAAPAPVFAEGENAPPHTIERQKWTFGGMFGYFDQQQLRRGYKIYKTVCTNCHSMKLLSYRNLSQPGGPEFPKEVVDQIALEAQVADGPNDEGKMFERPGKASDRFVSPFKNDKEAAAANNGAVPPDLSLIAKARGVELGATWYTLPYLMLKDMATQYQEGGSDYIYAVLTSYKEAPADKKMAPGMNYNAAFPGNQIAMPQPLQDGTVDYEDKTPNTLDQEAKDVAAFLTWAAEPHLVERKKLGIWVLVYLSVLTGLLIVAKKTLWRNVEH